MRLLAFVAVLLLSACTKGDAQAQLPVSYCAARMFEDARFTVCDPRGGRLMLVAAGKTETSVRSFAELAKSVDTSTVAFAMNAGMFDGDGRPIGLASVGGRQKHKVNLRDGPGNFHMKPNGVFIVTANGGAMVVPSDRVPQFRAPPQLEIQSGPMLVINGKLHPAFEADGQSRLVRNGVGVTASGKPLFVISDGPVSFGKFARFFRDGLKAPNALFFDGSVSSLWDPANARQDSHAALGPIIVALKPVPKKAAVR
jgi:prepilin-type processing-associated H-X9-DG protein